MSKRTANSKRRKWVLLALALGLIGILLWERQERPPDIRTETFVRASARFDDRDVSETLPAERMDEPLDLPEDVSPLRVTNAIEEVAPLVTNRPTAVELISEIALAEEVEPDAEALVDEPFEIELVRLPPGEFWLGDAGPAVDPRRRLPRKRVELTYEFWMGKYEVTVGQFRESGIAMFGGEQPNDFDPVTMVSHDEGMAFCRWLQSQYMAEEIPVGYEFRLPTEAEWEYANAGWRGVENVELVWRDYAVLQPGSNFIMPVGDRRPKFWGLHDMLGNASEWCLDTLYLDANAISGVNPIGRMGVRNQLGPINTIRGGSWQNEFEISGYGFRHSMHSGRGTIGVGFRVALAPTPEFLEQAPVP